MSTGEPGTPKSGYDVPKSFDELGRQQLEIYARELGEHLRQERELRQQLESRVRELEALNRMFQRHLQERFTLVESYQELREHLKETSHRLQEAIARADAVALPQLESPVPKDLRDADTNRELRERLKEADRRLKEAISRADAVVLPQMESPLSEDPLVSASKGS